MPESHLKQKFEINLVNIGRDESMHYSQVGDSMVPVTSFAFDPEDPIFLLKRAVLPSNH